MASLHIILSAKSPLAKHLCSRLLTKSPKYLNIIKVCIDKIIYVQLFQLNISKSEKNIFKQLCLYCKKHFDGLLDNLLEDHKT